MWTDAYNWMASDPGKNFLASVLTVLGILAFCYRAYRVWVLRGREQTIKGLKAFIRYLRLALAILPVVLSTLSIFIISAAIAAVIGLGFAYIVAMLSVVISNYWVSADSLESVGTIAFYTTLILYWGLTVTFGVIFLIDEMKKDSPDESE